MGKFLVGDLKFLKRGKNRQEKFAQILVTNETLLQLLAQLKPGQKITAETLKQFFGEELALLRMAHTNEKSFNMVEGAEKNILFNPKAGVDPYSQARLERNLFSSRRQEPKKTGYEGLPQEAAPKEGNKGVFANVYELMGLRRRLDGKFRIFTLVAYSIMAGAVGLAIVFLASRLW